MISGPLSGGYGGGGLVRWSGGGAVVGGGWRRPKRNFKKLIRGENERWRRTDFPQHFRLHFHRCGPLPFLGTIRFHDPKLWISFMA